MGGDLGCLSIIPNGGGLVTIRFGVNAVSFKNGEINGKKNHKLA
jgi:hypothetical protein